MRVSAGRWRRLWSGRRLHGRDEAGSLLAVIVLIAAIALLGLAFANRVFGDLQSSSYEKNHQAARAQAFAGLSDALFRMEQQGANPQSFCVGPASLSTAVSMTCSPQSVPSAPGAQYVAQLAPNSLSSYTVTVKGTVNGVSYGLTANADTVPIYQFGAFGLSSLTLNGTGGNIVATDASGDATYCPSNSTNPCPAQLGSDGTITCHGTNSYGTGQVTFGGGNNNCPVPVVGAGNYLPLPPVPGCPGSIGAIPPQPCLPAPPSGTTYPNCPADASGNVNALLEPGIYECTGSKLNFTNVSVDYTSTANGGAVQIYLFPPTGQGDTINFTGPVNQWQDQANGVTGNPADLQVYAAGSGTITATGAVDSILYAPGWDMTIDGSAKLTWTGSFIVNQFTMNGNPTLNVNYDNRVQVPALSTWKSSNVHSIPPAKFP